MRFHLFHFLLYIADAVPVGIEYIGAEIRFVQRREEVLRHQSHDDEGEDEQCYHASQCQHLLAYQRAEDGGEFMIERLVVWVFVAIFAFAFSMKLPKVVVCVNASTQLNPSEMASTTNSGFTISATEEGAR